MNFIQLKKTLQTNFQKMAQEADDMFEVNLDKDVLWDLYLDSFPEGTNEMFRKRREYDCSCCRHFIKSIGNVVSIKDNKIKTIWDFELGDTTFDPVLQALSDYVHSHDVSNVYVSKIKHIGTDKNYEDFESGEIVEWDHFYLELPSKFVNVSYGSEAEVMGGLRDTRNVFKRSLDELSENSILTVLELISQNSLYKGQEWELVLTEFLKHKVAYEKLVSDQEKENYAWGQSLKVGGAIGRIRNHSIGTLLIDITKNIDLDKAVRKYEVIVAPSNYRRPKAIYTKRMLEDAQKTVQELGYGESLQRRFATLDDITVNNILFSNKDVSKRLSGGLDVFDEMKDDIVVNPKNFSKVEDVPIDKFISDVLPTTQEIEVLLENKHASNMVSLIAPDVKDSDTMFKWSNGFGWAYSGNITDSDMRERVKTEGGNVEGELRFSIQWNDSTSEYDKNDLDAHCIEPSGNLLYYGNEHNRQTTGRLDVDIMNPKRGLSAVENITWTSREKMQNGEYQFLVHNYSHRGGKNGFKAEIEFDGQIYSFVYDKDIGNNKQVAVATVVFDRKKGFSIKEDLPSDVSSREVWGVKTNKFVPVTVVMNSPNYWDEQQGIGHKHMFFMLRDCENPEKPNGFFNEYLKEDLNKHRRVFEALGSRLSVKDSEDQLSGIGFSSTKRNELVVKVSGQTTRIMRIKF